ncbi:MAG TPA: hypothetical protein VGK27_00325 [Candidatus Deferrimicrobiaceae bacterium]
MSPFPPGKYAVVLAVACLFALLAACGGGGSDSASTTTTITGSVFAAPMNGASVSVRNAAGNIVAGPVATAPDGSYSIPIPNGALAGALRFESSGGTFTDEATGTASTPGGPLSAYAEAGTLRTGSAIHLTPISTIVHDLRLANRTSAQARDNCVAAFGFTDNASVGPRNDNAVMGMGVDNVARRLAGLRAVAFSQMARDLGVSPDNQFKLIAALGSDLRDGVLDGRFGVDNVDIYPGKPLPEDIQNRFANALATCFLDPAVNKTGLTATQIGAPPMATVALTPTWRVEYLPGSAAPAQGRTDFGIKVNRRSDGVAMPGRTLRIVPWMYMATKDHSSPIDNAIGDNTDGTYTCTVYYVMGSAGMGFWELRVVVDGETATFHPFVNNPGADTARATLKGTDNAASVPVAQRNYFLFKDGPMTGATGAHTFKVYLAANDNQSTFPQLQVGTVLHTPAGAPFTVDAILVDASTDNTFNSSVVTGTPVAGTAHWSFPGLSGLISGQTGNVYVRLTVNGERKTTSGAPDNGTNGFATFTILAP